MSSDYRSWKEREAAAEKTRAEAARIQADAAAAAQVVEAGAARTATEQMAEQVKQAKLAKQLKAVQEDATDEEQQRKQQRREQAADNGSHFKALVNVVMVLGLLAALPAQLSYFLKLHKKGEQDPGYAWLMLPVPFFLELLAWVGVLGTQWAHRKGLPRWPFWILTASLASVAGYINLTHGTEEYGIVAGVALAATSIIGPVLAEVRQFLETKAAADPRSLQQRAADKVTAKVKAEAEKAAARTAAAEDSERQKLFPEEFAEYRRIMVAHPTGAIDRDTAWEQAWHNLHLLPLSVTAGTLAAREAARAGIESVLSNAGRTPESIAVDLLLAEMFGPDRGDGGPAGGASGGSPSGGTGGGSGAASAGGSKTATALGRKGKQASGRTAPKAPEKPLDPADIDKVRKLAEALGGTDRLSARNVREVIGGGSNEYAVRLRNRVKTETREEQK
ncbi:hypothetical protein [Streptomyces wuyuanensis]|uniref:DUF2637 domain-containing protein n=1 Tax=Streptomyces wuyuanensis TaxID=1196353 RepID=A0A1G9Z9Y6_9ACTN|nr:hypothetical protein [Streptomyces wuyuanensis]SDN18189.1 hypothetical protein SAMN05444921_12144 [Streptomyces wuyuanensis]